MQHWPWGYKNAPPGHVYMPPAAAAPEPRPTGLFWETTYPQTVAPATTSRSFKYPSLNPALAADVTQIRWDIRKRAKVDIISSQYHSNRHTPVMEQGTSAIRLISTQFPWTIDAVVPAGVPLTCEVIWDAIYLGLRAPLQDSEWGMIVGNKKIREVVERTYKRRVEGGDKERLLKRIDSLGEATMFRGLEKDDEFERIRRLPGDNTQYEVWVVKLST